MTLMHTVLVVAVISNVGAGPSLFDLLTKLTNTTLKEVSPKSISSVKVPPSQKIEKIEGSRKCRTIVHRLAWICFITVHYKHHEDLKVRKLNLLKLSRTQIRNALCPCPQGNIAPFCPKFIANFVFNYRHEVICADDYDLNAPLLF